MGLFRSKKFEDTDVDVASVLSNLKRLQAITRTGLLKHEPRADLDALSKEAAERCHAPMAQITVVDDQKQLFFSAFGKTGPMADATEGTLDTSYCKYVVAYADVLAVEDAATDPLVRKEHENGMPFRSYLGVPLKVGGEIVGSFCVFADQPRTWSNDDLNGLEEIAQEVMQHIDDELDESHQ